MGRVRGKRMFYGNGQPIHIDENCFAEFHFNEGTGSVTADAQDWSTKVATIKNALIWSTPSADEKASISDLLSTKWAKTATQTKPPYVPSLDGATNYIDCGIFTGIAFSFGLEVDLAVASFSTSTANAFTFIAGKWDTTNGKTLGLVLCTTVNGGDLNQVGLVLCDKETGNTYLGALSTDDAIEAGTWYSVKLNYLDGVPEILINNVAKSINDVYNTTPTELLDNDEVPFTVGSALNDGSPVFPTAAKIANASFFKRPPGSEGNYATHRRVSRIFSDGIVGAGSISGTPLHQHQYLGESLVETAVTQSIPGDHHHFISSLYESLIDTDTRKRSARTGRQLSQTISMNAMGSSDMGTDIFSRILYESAVTTDIRYFSLYHNSYPGATWHAESDVLSDVANRHVHYGRTVSQTSTTTAPGSNKSMVLTDSVSRTIWNSTVGANRKYQSEILTDVVIRNVWHTTTPGSNWRGESDILFDSLYHTKYSGSTVPGSRSENETLTGSLTKRTNTRRNKSESDVLTAIMWSTKIGQGT
jgi:hypothetical protein